MNVKHNNELGIMDTPVKPEYDKVKNMQQCRMDTGVKHQYDRKEVYRYDNEINCYSGRSFLGHSGPRAGIQSNNKLMPKAFRIAEHGRSMVETIGVLAVIGVLTIGGIAGYNYGINKHRANQVLQDIRLIYQETKYPNSVRQIVETGSFPDMELDTQSPYDYSFDFPDLNDFIYESSTETTPNLISVNVSGVPDTACDILLKTKPEYVLILKANGQSVWTCDKDENELSYIFEITSDSLEYGTCSVCTGKHCFDDDLNCPEGEYCYNDTCSRCAHGYTENKSGQCVQCSASWNGINTVDEENCLRCGDNAYSKHHKKCYSCDKMSNWETTLDECNECSHNPNVVAMKTTTTGHVGCFNCKNFGYYPWAEKAQCEKCMAINDNIIFYPKDANGTSTTGLCTKCDTKNADGTACECPTGQFWVFADGNHSFCRKCSEINSTYTSKIECDKCPNHYYDVAKGGNDRNGECKLCPSGQVKDTSADGDGRRCVAQ